jgi:hypothetical protein
LLPSLLMEITGLSKMSRCQFVFPGSNSISSQT